MSSSKRHFTAVIGNKEQGTYVSSTPSSAARKAVSKLCADDKKREIKFSIRETTRDSNKKVYGSYIGYMQKLDKKQNTTLKQGGILGSSQHWFFY